MDCMVVMSRKDVTFSIQMILKIPNCLGGRGKESPNIPKKLKTFVHYMTL
jgi:hypothetical protein